MNYLDEILKKIKGKHSITYNELNDILPKGYILEEHIENILEFLGKHNIEIIEHSHESYKIKKNHANDIIIDNLINTPDKFYFYELNKNKKLKAETENIFLDELIIIKGKIISLLVETIFFQFQLYRDIIKIKPSGKINYIFTSSFNETDIISENIKKLFKKYSSNKNDLSCQIELISYLQKLNFKFIYMLKKIKLLKQIHNEILETEKNDKKKAILTGKKNKINSHLLYHLLPELNYLLKKYETIKKKIIKNQLPLVLSIVKHYFKSTINNNDLIQEGNIALIEAVDYYNKIIHKKKFYEFVSSWVRKKIKDYISKNNTLITFSTNFRKDCKLFLKVFKELKNQSLQIPTFKEVQNKLDWSDKKIFKIINYLKAEDSLEREDPYRKLKLQNALYDKSQKMPEDIAIENILKEQIIDFLEQLPKKEKIIIKMRFGFNFENKTYKYKEIAKNLQLTENDIKNIEEYALKKLRIIFKNNNMEEFI